jgi:hypothetical protein
MKTQIRTLKLKLKDLASQIKNQKNVRKKSHPAHADVYSGDYSLSCLRESYRYHHVAYCLARGRTLESVDSGAGLNMERVNWILKCIEPESREKLYVVVNETLSPSQQAVQSAHAVAEFMRKNPHTLWANGYLILLKDRPLFGDNMSSRWHMPGIERAEFIEPDLSNKITAYACFGHGVENLMKNHKLV